MVKQGVRTFVALPLPESSQRSLKGFEDHWRGRLHSRLSWTRPGNWHLTLRFLGEVEDMEGVVRALHAVRQEPGQFQPAGAGFFPSRRRPRVAWLGVKQGQEQVMRLAARVSAALETAGFAPEGRQFRPHLTLARIRRDRGDDWATLAHAVETWAWPAVHMDEFVLYKSEPGPEGPGYSRLKSYPLNG